MFSFRSSKAIFAGLLTALFLAGCPGWSSSAFNENRLNALLLKKPGQTVITAVGDLIFMRKISQLDQPDRLSLYRLLQTSDVTYGNLEMSLNSQPDTGVYTFVKDREFVWEIAAVGFNMLGLANNHQLDCGITGLEECLSILKKANIRFAGGGLDFKESLAPALYKTDDLTVAFLSFYSEDFETSATQDSDKPSIATIRAPKVLLAKDGNEGDVILAPLKKDIRVMADAIATARRHAEIVVVAIHVHWVDHASRYGVPDVVPPNQSLIFHRAVSAGADIVLGSGPHVLRGIELYKGKPVFYSLGNFIYQYKKDHIPPVIYQRDPQQDKDKEFQSIVARFVFDRKQLSQIQLVPVVLDQQDPFYGCPRLTGEAKGRTILENLAALSQIYGTKITISDMSGVVSLK